MAELAQFVSVQITAGTSQPSQRGFGVPLLLGYHTRFAENVRTYTGINGLISDGFTVDDPVYKMAAAVFSQNPRPEYIKVGRLPAPGSAHTLELDVNGITSGTITLQILDHLGNATDVSEAFDTSSGTTATNLAATLDAIANIGASAVGDVVTVTADTNGPVVFVRNVSSNLEVRDVTADWAYDTQLALILNEDSDFYGIAIDVNSPANMLDVAAWALANKRIAVFGPQYPNPADHTAANTWRLGDNDRVASVLRYGGRDEAAGAAFLGRWLPYQPGSVTMAFKALAGVVADAWTASQLTTIAADNSMAYTTVAQLPVTLDGKAHGGEFLDVRRGLDWLEARLQERIFALLANTAKVPMTNAGIQMVVNEIEGQLSEAVDVGLLEEGSTLVTFKDISDIPAADRAARLLSGIEFSGRLAGAVHKITMFGNFDV